jgi:hypothetical protein
MLRIELSGLPPRECSPNWRGHWAIKARHVAEYRETTRIVARSYLEAYRRRGGTRAGTTVVFGTAPDHATMHVTFVVPDNRRRDKTNLAASFKPALDGLVDAGIIKDDSHQCLDDQYHIEVRTGQRMTIVEVA